MEIATDLLEMMGATVIPAVNGREAVARFEESEPFENACRRLLEAKKKLYSLNRTVVSKLHD